MSIILDQISKHYGSLRVVDRVSLEIEDGELFVLLGASGSGKSTILRLIAGLTPPTSGAIWLHGRDVTHLPPQQRDIGLVFQNYSIFRHMNVSDNIEFGLSVRKVPRRERVRRRDELLELVGLAGLGNRYAHQLSGGQQQRVALARALAHEPKVLLLDEPFGALDVKIRTQLRRSLKQIQRKLNVTTILVTHDQEEAFELADRIGVIEKGRLLEVGPSQELYRRPRSSFVATFLGSGTVLAGRVREGTARFGSLRLPIPEEIEAAEESRIQVLVRPEDVLLDDRQLPETCVPLGRGRIVEERFTGPRRRIRLQLSSLSETRQVAPVVPFGQEGWLLEAVVPAERSFQSCELQVGLAGWHLMVPPAPRLLVVVQEFELEVLRRSVKWLVEQIDGWATFLEVVSGHRKGSGEGVETGDEHRPAACSRLDTRLRQGDFASEVLAELQEESYDMLLLLAAVLKGSSGPGARLHHFPAAVETLLQETTVPVLLVQNGFERISKVLICTAAGEPGKQDVREGGRLARRLGAQTTLLHVRTKENPRVSGHLEQAAATLRSLQVGVLVRRRLAPSAAAGILAEAEEGKFDLIVVGRHGRRAGRLLGDEDVTRKVILGSNQPILIVPTDSGKELWDAAKSEPALGRQEKQGNYSL